VTTKSFDEHPDTCGCCEAEAGQPTHENRPGQSTLNYRIGTHSAFLQRMLARLPREEIPEAEDKGKRPLAALTTRSPEDPTVAFLDAWATVGDVLTFYQERIANEGFLRTATERRSVLELARAIGYELNPGVAASTYLVFKVDESDSTPDTAMVPAGTQVQSIPAAQGELPQTFETSEEFEARVEWNALKPRVTTPDFLLGAKADLYLKGVETRLQPGDALLIISEEPDKRITELIEDTEGSEERELHFLTTVEPHPTEGYTRVTWGPQIVAKAAIVRVPLPPDIPIPLFTFSVYAFRQRANLFGYNAPDWRVMAVDVKQAYTDDPNFDPNDYTTWGDEWPLFEFGGMPPDPIFPEIDLDAVYPKILQSSWIALSYSNTIEVYNVTAATNAARADFALTAKTTRLTLDSSENLDQFDRRGTVVYSQSEELERAEIPLTTPVAGNTIQLGSLVAGLQEGQPIVVTGKLGEADVDLTSEVAFVDYTSDSGIHTTIVLEDSLVNSYIRSTVTIYANVVHATHGETVSEVLGSGDGARTNQRFQLKKPPLTYVPAATASGAASTLELRVNGVLWEEAVSLLNQGPLAQTYIVRINDNAEATVIFGDGKEGARLPTGPENLTARYRAGIGSGGEVGGGSLKLLKTRPFGVRDVTNPVAASGAADPEKLENARINAPLTVLTLDRVVSLKDFEDFARGFTGIGKAQVLNLWSGETYLVHITIADDDGDPVPEDVRQMLGDAIDAARDPSAEVQIDNYELLTFNLEATVQFDSRYRAESVQSDLERSLKDAFSFDRRDFGQPVTAAEIIGVIHQIEGVVAVDLDALSPTSANGSTQPQALEETGLASVLPALTARIENGRVSPAQLLLIDASGITLTMKSV
jgi:predicted phage baseplate assembly protein